MKKKVLIKNAKIVNEGSITEGDVFIEDGIITEIASSISPKSPDLTIIDAEGNYLLPGLIDDQVHFREPGLEYKADMATESAAAVAGGLTSVMDMPNTNPPTLDSAALEASDSLLGLEGTAYEPGAGRLIEITGADEIWLSEDGRSFRLELSVGGTSTGIDELRVLYAP